jgi:hypothetical protein
MRTRKVRSPLCSFLLTAVAVRSSAAQFDAPGYITEDRPVPSQQIVLDSEALDRGVWFVWTDPALKSGVSFAKQPVPSESQFVITTAPEVIVARREYWIEAQYASVFAPPVRRRPSR